MRVKQFHENDSCKDLLELEINDRPCIKTTYIGYVEEKKKHSHTNIYELLNKNKAQTSIISTINKPTP